MFDNKGRDQRKTFTVCYSTIGFWHVRNASFPMKQPVARGIDVGIGCLSAF